MKFKKTIVGAAIVSMVLGTICVGIGLVFGGSFHALQISMGVDGDGFFFRQYGDIEYDNMTLEDVTSLQVDMSLGSITIVEEDRDDIKILNTIKGRYSLDVKNEKAVLRVNKNRGFSFFNFGNEYSQDIEILVPRGFVFDDLDLHNSMGDITIEDIQSKKLSIEVDLGDIETKNITSDSLKVDNAMGNIQLDGVFLNKSNIRNDLGDTEVRVRDDIRNYDYQTDCSLGSIEVNGQEGNTSQNLQNENHITIKNSMGDITLDFD